MTVNRLFYIREGKTEYSCNLVTTANLRHGYVYMYAIFRFIKVHSV